MKKLGSRQRDVLSSLVQHGSWHARCGWVWDTPSSTQRLMESLVRAGYATARGEGSARVYRPAKVPRAVILSGGNVVDGDDAPAMLKLQHRILLLLSKNLAAQGHGEGSTVQKAIADANMLGLEVAERLSEL